ncbi:hypothetical protein BKA80DRAFT_283578 [Phyllosticta citrichinensis]
MPPVALTFQGHIHAAPHRFAHVFRSSATPPQRHYWAASQINNSPPSLEAQAPVAREPTPTAAVRKCIWEWEGGQRDFIVANGTYMPSPPLIYSSTPCWPRSTCMYRYPLPPTSSTSTFAS